MQKGCRTTMRQPFCFDFFAWMIKSGKNRFALFPSFSAASRDLMGLWVSPAGSVGANPCATGAPRPQTPQPFEKGWRKLHVCTFSALHNLSPFREKAFIFRKPGVYYKQNTLEKESDIP
ncbi:MAG TPA: hypothetical protein IAB89_02400 [Candidatus Caccousia avicola]|uniref:Uncharacterized protein n=1 Tax=Candidatus Caccousia avicola TaxID=2840721 RepID=A0A9D1DF27_9FIRM|nr:hypothetical protein [Candidatus Caccousia avicola]